VPEALAFADARAAREWLNALPLTNIPQAQSLVLEQLHALNRGAFDDLERLKTLELMRDKIAFLQGEQRSRYFGKSLPLSGTDMSAWTTGRTLLEEMEAAYRKCLDGASSNAGLEPHRALLMQRIVRYIGAQMLFHAMIYKRFEPGLWTRLHQQYVAAETAGAAETRVKDSLEAAEAGSSVAEAYAHVVLFQAAFLSEMMAPQTDFVEALLRLWSRKIRVLSEVPADAPEQLALVMDPAKAIGARPMPKGEFLPGQRMVDVSGLSMSIRKRVHGLQTGEDYATLGLPPEGSSLDVQGELKRLHKLWCEGAPPRPPGKPSTVEKAGLVFGLADTWFFVSGGKAFEQPDKKRELTREEKQDIEVFGQVTERTQSRMKAQHVVNVDSWEIVEELRGAVRVIRPSTASKNVAIGRILGIRLGDTGPFYLGAISELVQETDNRILVTIRMLPGKPEPIAVRQSDMRMRASAQWTPAFRLPPLERLSIPASLVVPSGIAARGRGIELFLGEAKESTVEEVIERGSDYDRITTF
jgi:hypothetical protein